MIKITMENGVITWDNGERLKFHPKCPKCGFVDENTLCNAFYGLDEQTVPHPQTCKKCTELIRFVIKREEV